MEDGGNILFAGHLGDVGHRLFEAVQLAGFAFDPVTGSPTSRAICGFISLPSKSCPAFLRSRAAGSYPFLLRFCLACSIDATFGAGVTRAITYTPQAWNASTFS